MKYIFPLLITISFNVSAAIKKPADELARYRSEVMQMGAKLTSLEKEIGSKNNLYISSIEQIKQFETDVKIYKEALGFKQLEVLKSQKENKRILHSYLLESDNESSETWQRKVHLELLKTAQDKLSAKETEIMSFSGKVEEIEKKIVELKGNEEELSNVIKELELRKKEAMGHYLAKVELKKKVEDKVQANTFKVKIAQVKKQLSFAPIVQKKADRIFANPVDDFLTYTPSPKGVTFKYQATQPVKAVGSGKVVFAGDLASYGQVVLVDHGDDLRTVLLGKMNIRVKKNDIVNNGDILGYTINDSKEAQNLYFEVRKKNTAQNTILWLDQRAVSKI